MKYTKAVEMAVRYAKRSAKRLSQNYIGTEHLLLGILHGGADSMAATVLMDADIEEKNVIKLIMDLVSFGGDVAILEHDGETPKYRQVMEFAETQAKLCHMEEVGTEHVLLAIIRTPDCAAARLLASMDLDLQKLFNDLLLAMGKEGELYRQSMNARSRRRGMDGDYPTLRQFSTDLTEQARQGELDPVIGRTPEIQRLIQILSRRTKNNPCLIGEPGVGKTAIVEGLAQHISLGMVPDSVRDKKVLSLDLSGMVAGTKYRGEFEERIKNVIKEAIAAGNVLLFIDEIHTMIGAGGAEGSMDAANILKPAMARGQLQVIGATTVDEYRKYIEKDAALERRFQPIMVEEPSEAETIDILKGLRESYENHHGISISDEALEACVGLSVRYINDRFLPDKAIDLMDEASAKKRLMTIKVPTDIYEGQERLKTMEQELEDAIASSDLEEASRIKAEIDALRIQIQKAKARYERTKKRKNEVLDVLDIAQVVSEWTKIPVSKLSETEAHRLVNLEKTLHKRIIGQEEAVSAVARAVRRGRVGLKEPSRPIGSFLFLGPTGVGKTEIAKALAQTVFGDENNMIRVDMTEYMEKHSVSKMIGSPPGYVGYEEGGQLSEKVRRNPYSVILFDEIEKAHPDVFNVLLQVLDDGHVTDAKGRKVDFKNTIIIMTSNAGASEIMNPKRLGFAQEHTEKADFELMKSRVMEELKHTFKPEFLNRIDETIVFRALNKKDLEQITKLLLNDLINRCEKQLHIKLKVGVAARRFIVEKAYDPKFGARPLRRKIQTDMEDILSDEILSGKIKQGDAVTVEVRGDHLGFVTEHSKTKKTNKKTEKKKTVSRQEN
ncbi:MAG: ATP-dependent Clp protease ATP-binding subunit [Lachnospiraceae bacterium]|nr:ATP-dependent Clp protease ATP-binding subunit [Lachnospiraceae bacterium]